MKAINVLWDVDDDSELKMLPDEIEIPEEYNSLEGISEYITNLTGFCHNGFEIAVN